MMKRSTATLAVSTLLAAGAATAADEPVKSCISLQRIDHTEVADNQNILFYMLDDSIYRNTLADACPGLDFGDGFMYRVALDQLCNIDIITVLEGPGVGFTPGASCVLGKFNKVSESMAERILAEPADAD